MIETLDHDLCDGCGICMDVCPMDVFRRDAAGVFRIVYEGDCMTCFNCELECHMDAVHVGPFRKSRVQAWAGCPEASP